MSWFTDLFKPKPKERPYFEPITFVIPQLTVTIYSDRAKFSYHHPINPPAIVLRELGHIEIEGTLLPNGKIDFGDIHMGHEIQEIANYLDNRIAEPDKEDAD